MENTLSTTPKRRKINQGEFPSLGEQDERIEKALQTANYIATLSNQRRVIKEEFEQKIMYYFNGGTFKCDQSLIGFLKALIDSNQHNSVTIIDNNGLPIVVDSLEVFLDNVITNYFEAVNEYSVKFNRIKNKRNIKDIVSL